MLLSRGDEFVATVAEKLLTYALGRGTEYYDMPDASADPRPRQGRQLPLVVAHPGHRREPAVPDAAAPAPGGSSETTQGAAHD